MEIVSASISQVNPITATTATVLVIFKFVGAPPDLVQIYASRSTDDVGVVADTVDISLTEFVYSSSFDLQAGVFYNICICPRTKTGEVLDDRIDGQYWESLCKCVTIVTRALPSPGGQLPAPEITTAELFPATLHADNSIKISWVSSHEYGKYLVRWGLSGLPPDQHFQVEIDSGGTSGWFVAQSTKPREGYVFIVEGAESAGLVGWNYSPWSGKAEVTAGDNATSLREFLRLSGIESRGLSLRSVVPAGETLRRFMKL
jgi:hypothetical protein